MIRRPPRSTLFPTRRSSDLEMIAEERRARIELNINFREQTARQLRIAVAAGTTHMRSGVDIDTDGKLRSEEHTSELQSQSNLVCRLLLEKKKIQELSTRTSS